MILNSSNFNTELEYFKILGYTVPDNIEIPDNILFSNFNEIAIIGNGFSETSYGSIIDSFEHVCRFNSYKIDNYEDLVGKKVTHHVINSLSFKHIKPSSIENNIQYILMDTGRPKVAFDFYFNNIKHMDNIFLMAPSHYVKLGRFFKNKCKTQGFLFTETAKMTFQKIHLFGFCSNTHYFNRGHKMDRAHPVQEEHDMYELWSSDPNFKINA
jgi:hypothetical protein